MQKPGHVVGISGGRIDTSILYRFTTLDCVNVTVSRWIFFNSRVVGCETSGGYLHGSDMLLAPALSYNALTRKINGSNIELLRRMLPAKRSRRPLFDPACTLM